MSEHNTDYLILYPEKMNRYITSLKLKQQVQDHFDGSKVSFKSVPIGGNKNDYLLPSSLKGIGLLIDLNPGTSGAAELFSDVDGLFGPKEKTLLEKKGPENSYFFASSIESDAASRLLTHQGIEEIFKGNVFCLAPEQANKACQDNGRSSSIANISMQVLAGFMAVVGCVAVAVAFNFLNAATFGTAGMLLAGAGVGAAMVGAGFFVCNSQPPTDTEECSRPTCK